jgi:hypothetical protein
VPKSVSVLIENPRAIMPANVPMIDDGDGQQRDQRRPPVLQEDEHHQQHQHDAFDQGLDDLLRSRPDELTGLVGNLVLDALGKDALDSSSIAFLTFLNRSTALAPVCR